MKTKIFIAAAALVLIVSGSVVLAQQQGYGQGYGPQGQGWFCPWCGQQYGQGMGPGMMQRGQGMRQGWQGQGMGPGMIQRWQGQGMGPGMMQGYHGRGMGRCMRSDQWGRGQYGPSGGQQQMKPLTQSKAKQLADDYVAGNPNLKIGDVSEKDEVFEARVETKDGSLVEKLLIDKQTGWLKRAY